jgi:hypothetical protein
MLRLGFRRSGSAPARRAEGPAAPAGAGRPRFTIRLAAAALGLLGAFALLEVGLRVLTAFELIHVPGMSAPRRSHGFHVRYRTNSLGARDVEHAPGETVPRVLALGDSYLEGRGVEPENRVTDLLQKSSGLEFMNLAMSHFGPYQELLAYREFAPRFEHHAVLIGILPMNDFDDLDRVRERPSLTGSFPDYHRVDRHQSGARRFLRHESAAVNALAWMWDALANGREGFDPPPPFATPTGTVHSFYYDYSRKDSLLLRDCLRQLAAAAQGRPVIVVLLPAPPDFLRYAQAGPPPLTRDLEAQGLEDGFRVIDLLPDMAARTRDAGDYFLSCDDQWNEVGHAAAADILGTRLRESFLPFPPVAPRPDDLRATAAAARTPR